MGWFTVRCANFDCSKFMITKAGTKRKKCPYCGRSFKVNDNFIKSYASQEEARNAVKRLNQKL